MSNFWLIGPRSGFVDSIFYDAAGNVSKVVETIYSSQPTLTFNLFEFSGRATQGDQFYNFNKKVYNGISNFPEFFDGFLAGSTVVSCIGFKININNFPIYRPGVNFITKCGISYKLI